MKKVIYTVVTIVFVSLWSSCSKDDLEPALNQNKEIDKIENLGDLSGLLVGAHDKLSNKEYYGRDYIIYNEVRSDNTFSTARSNRYFSVGNMKMITTDAYAADTWGKIYQVIAAVNLIINADLATISGDAANINHVVGQAYALRALAHFDLLKLYGQQNITGMGGNDALGIPYVTTYRALDEIYPDRNTVAEVKEKVLADLDKSFTLMDTKYDTKQIISLYAAHAIKARVYLYFGDKDKVATETKLIIDSGKFSIAEADTFISNFASIANKNSIFEVAFNAADNNGSNSLANIYRGSYGDIEVVDDFFYNGYEPADVRVKVMTKIVDKKTGLVTALRNTGKYPKNESNVPLIRYEEVILMYAEALIESNPAEALTYLNMIPEKRNASLYTAATLENVLLERKKELAFEGFRFDDLARTKQKIPLVSKQQKHGGPEYGSYNFAFPIPYKETSTNSNLVQNFGYF